MLLATLKLSINDTRESRTSSFYFLYYLLFLCFLCAVLFFFLCSLWYDRQKKYIIEFVFEWKVTHYKILGRIEARVSYYCYVNKLSILSDTWARSRGNCLMLLNFKLICYLFYCYFGFFFWISVIFDYFLEIFEKFLKNFWKNCETFCKICKKVF